MKKNIIIAAVALLTPTTAQANKAFNTSMGQVLTEYLVIQKAFAGDSDAGVAKAAGKIVKLAGKVKTASLAGKHAKHYKKLPGKIKAAAEKLVKAKGIKAGREVYKELSRPLVMWATLSKVMTVNIVFCSMAKGSWLQAEKVIANPYYGASMLRCGEVIGGRDTKHAGASGTVKVAFASKPPVGTKARCPVMKHVFTVNANTDRSVHKGKHYAYCCAGCKPKFDANPKKYLKK